jgi:glycosyltransferase involved in cell wall biosynthesis
MSVEPACSLIVTCRNPGARLGPTLASALEQRRAAVEVIVVDQGSNDGTPAWLEARRGEFAAVVNLPGAGRVAAANAGIERARGDWVHFLRPGDRLAGDGVVAEVLVWARKTEAGVVVGETASDEGELRRLPARVNALAGEFAPPPGTFYRRSLFAENGSFEPELPTAADYEFQLRLWKGRVRFKPLPIRVAACGTHRPAAGPWIGWREEVAVRRRYFPLHRSLPWDALGLARAAWRGLLPGRG